MCFFRKQFWNKLFKFYHSSDDSTTVSKHCNQILSFVQSLVILWTNKAKLRLISYYEKKILNQIVANCCSSFSTNYWSFQISCCIIAATSGYLLIKGLYRPCSRLSFNRKSKKMLFLEIRLKIFYHQILSRPQLRCVSFCAISQLAAFCGRRFSVPSLHVCLHCAR